MKLSDDTVYVYKSADGNIKAIVKAKFNFDLLNFNINYSFDVIYDKNHNRLEEIIQYC